MQAVFDKVRSGTWLTGHWYRLITLTSLMYGIVTLGLLIIGAKGFTSADGMILGPDFSEIWAAGRSVLNGKPALPFEINAHYELQKQLFGESALLLGWCYPPFLLLVATALATMPYVPALIVWQGATFAAYVAVMRRIAPPALALLAILAFPGALVNIVNGHNGFMTAALIGGGMYFLDKRPIVAGICIGCLSYKPQFGMLIPLALAAGGYWRTIFSASATVAVLIAVSLALFGVETWMAFFDNLKWTREVVLEQGSTGFYKMQSVFAAARMYGAPVSLAWAVQTVATLLTAVALAWLWNSKADVRLKRAALIASTILATPYSLDYDLTALAPAIAFAACYGREKGFRPYEVSVLALVWIMPPWTRFIAFQFYCPLGLLSTAAMFALILARAAEDGARLPWHADAWRWPLPLRGAAH